MRAVMHGVRQDQSLKDAALKPGTRRRVLAFARPHRALISVFVVVSMLNAAMVVVTPLLIQRLIDDGILGHDGRLITWLALGMLAAALVSAGLGLTSGYISSRIGEGLIYDLRTAVFAHVQRQSLAFFTRAQTGALVSRLNSDVMSAQTAFTSTLGDGVSNVVSVVVVGVTMAVLSWQLTLLCLVVFPLLWLTSGWVGRRLAVLTRRQMEANADGAQMMTERFNVGGAMLLKLFGRREEEDAIFAEKVGRTRDLGVQIALTTRTFMTTLTTVPALATVLVYGVGGHLAMSGHLTIGTVGALATLLLRLLAPLQGISSIRLSVMTALVSFERVFEVLDLPSLIQERPDAVVLPPTTAEVTFSHVAFGYPSADQISLASLESIARTGASADAGPVLHDIDFTAAPGRMVALVGHSGAGKTTVTHLVARLYDVTSGAVRLGGVDVRDATLDSIQATVGYVTQDAHMFHDTIRGNLLYARPDATESAIWAALEAAQIEGLVRHLPEGLDTVVGDRGYRLSGGERQRLAIARLLLKAPNVVVLDEATAHLDSESEAAVQAALDRALEGRTSIVTAHRLSTIRAADLILVIDAGRIVQRGTHESLLAEGGLYADLYRTQFERPAVH
jgi:ATP-binding cassette, subfamily B, bacterial